MAVYDHEEQEQLSELKVWWKAHGNSLLNIALLVVGLIAAYNGWNWWQAKQATEASALYAKMQMTGNDSKATLDIAVELADKYSDTVYADLAAFLAAKIQLEAGDLKNAKAQLGRVAEKSDEAAMVDMANLRLAGILFDEKAYDEAMKRLAAPKEKAFLARFEELRGDILIAQGKVDDARNAYAKAVAAMDSGKSADGQSKPDTASRNIELYREMLQIKLDALGGAA